MEKNDSSINGWSDRVEDLVDSGDVDGAISLLESVISNLETLGSSSSSPSPSGDLRLATALGDLADIHSSIGFSIKADELRSRALLVRARAVDPPALKSRDSEGLKVRETAGQEDEGIRASEPSNDLQDEDDVADWEAIADRVVSPEPLVSSQQQGDPLSLSRVDLAPKGAPKRRGRGSFLYQKSCLYSEQHDVGTANGDDPVSEEEVKVHDRRIEDDDSKEWKSRYGTGHVLVLYDFSPATRTGDLEKLFDKFQDRGFAIRWVNDTTALAVFRTPSIAQEAQNTIQCPFKVRQLEVDDDILTQIPRRELEPPIPRPRTSARTAQRLIAQGMGIKFPTDFGSNELRKQESERKSRILARQNMKDDAWGSD